MASSVVNLVLFTGEKTSSEGMRLVSKMDVKESNTKIRLAHSDIKKRDYFYRRFVATESFALERPETCSIYSPDMENGKSPSRLSFFSLCVLRVIFGRYHSPVSACRSIIDLLMVNYRRMLDRYIAGASPPAVDTRGTLGRYRSAIDPSLSVFALWSTTMGRASAFPRPTQAIQKYTNNLLVWRFPLVPI